MAGSLCVGVVSALPCRVPSLLLALAGISCGGLAARAADVTIRPIEPGSVSPFTPTSTAYAVFDGITLKSVFPGREYKADIYQGTIGFEVATTPELTLGAGIIATHAKNRLLYLQNGRSDTDGISGFLTGAYKLGLGFTVSGLLGYGGTRTDQFRTIAGQPSLSDYSSNGWFGNASVSNTLAFGPVFVTPFARIFYYDTRTAAYVESTGLLAPGQRSTLGRAHFGSQLAIAVPAGTWTIYPTAEVAFNYDFNLPLYQSDRTSWDIKLGISASRANLSVGANIQTTVDQQNYPTYYGGRVFVSYRF